MRAPQPASIAEDPTDAWTRLALGYEGDPLAAALSPSHEADFERSSAGLQARLFSCHRIINIETSSLLQRFSEAIIVPILDLSR
jgi:hypothetical protein